MKHFPHSLSLSLLTVLTCFLLSSAKPALAIEEPPFELTAIPPRLEIKAKPGETIQKTIRVKNSLATTRTIATSAEDFIVDSDGKTPIPIDQQLENRFSLASWIIVSPTSFTIGPNQTQVIDLVIQVPEDAAPGGRYAMVLHEAASKGTLTGMSGSGISPRVGTLLYLTVAGPVNEDAFIRNITLPRFLEFGPVPISFVIENRSDIHIRPQTSVRVTDMLGRLMTTIKVDDKNIFPYTARDFSTSFDQYWGLGRYTVFITSAYGENGNVTQAGTTFWIIPYRVIFTIIILAAALVAIWIAIRRHRHHTSNVQTQEIELLRERVHELEEEKKS